MKNSTAFLELVFATSHIGAVLLPINYRLSADEIGYIVRNSDARLLIADEELAAIAAGNAPIVPLDEAAQASATKLAPEAEPALMHPRRPKGENGDTQFFHCSVEMGKVILTTQMVKSMSLRQHTGAGYGPCWLFVCAGRHRNSGQPFELEFEQPAGARLPSEECSLADFNLGNN